MKHRESDHRLPPVDADRAQMAANLQKAGTIFTDEVLPGIDAFRAFMATENRKLEVAPFLDHIEGPQIIVQISRQDDRITATLHATITSNGIAPYWDVQSTGRVKTRWTETVPGGLAGLTRDHVVETLMEIYATDFS